MEKFKLESEFLRNILNKNHTKSGYSKHKICQTICDELRYEFEINYKMNFVVTDESFIKIGDKKFIFDDIVSYLEENNVVERKLMLWDEKTKKVIPYNGVGEREHTARRYFTTDFELYQKKQKRLTIIDKVLNNGSKHN